MSRDRRFLLDAFPGGGAVAAVALALVLVLAAALPAGAQSTFSQGSVEIVTSRGRFPVAVEIASTWAERMQGLQHRANVPEGTGMLFDFHAPEMVSMWMKNTRVPLDMLFIAADGTILRIQRDTTPFSLDEISSGWPVRAVLELRAGSVAAYGIQAGDKVVNPIFAPSSR